MINRFSILLCVLLPVSVVGQVLRDINYDFLYSSTEKFSFEMMPVKAGAQWHVYFTFQPRDTSTQAGDYLIQWEVRKYLSDKEGEAIKTDSVSKVISGNRIDGEINLKATSEVSILVARIINNKLKRAWLIYKMLEPNYPVNAYLTNTERVIFTSYVKQDALIAIEAPQQSVVVSYYSDNFPASAPPFSETLGKVNQGIKVDTTFAYTSGSGTSFSKPGLYLVQKDTNAIEGLAFRVVDDYPRLSKVQSLADPLIYICTKNEFDRVKAAKGDKKAFDRVILSITGDADRAKQFMRSYFRRVELANQFFTSYKEGWKTDRGMIFIVFGPPDQVFKFNDREVWSYKSQEVTFNFAKAPSVFDPDNYVLIREKKFMETWYEMIDLWRNARF